MFRFFLAVFFVLVSKAAFALPFYCPQDRCVGLGVEYLYLKPCVYDPFFLVREGGPGSTNEPRGERWANELEFQSGVRGWATWDPCLCDRMQLFVEGMYISDKHRRFIFVGTESNPPLALGTKGNPLSDLNSVENATSTIEYRLWNVKGGVNYCFCLPCPFLASTHLNVHYVKAWYCESLFYDETQNVVCSHAQIGDTWGLGPELGFDLGYRFTPCLGLVVRGTTAVLVVTQDARVGETDVLNGNIEDDIFARNDRLCTVQPYYELKVGLNYTSCFKCLKTEFEIGFDVLRYTDLIDHIRWIGDRQSGGAGGVGAEGLSLDYYSPFMLYGLYVSGSVNF